MIIVKVNFEKCCDCYECEELLPRFRTKYGGIMKIDNSDRDEELRAAAMRVKYNCPMEAVVIDEYPEEQNVV